jgi:hypothetical protein
MKNVRSVTIQLGLYLRIRIFGLIFPKSFQILHIVYLDDYHDLVSGMRRYLKPNFNYIPAFSGNGKKNK